MVTELPFIYRVTVHPYIMYLPQRVYSLDYVGLFKGLYRAETPNAGPHSLNSSS